MDLDKTITFAERIAKLVSELKLTPIVFTGLFLILASVCIVMAIVTYRSEKTSDDVKNQIHKYVVIREVAIKFAIALIVSMIFVEMIEGNNLIVNWVFCPTVGLVISSYIFGKVIAPIKARKVESQEPSKSDSSAITVNVNTNNTEEQPQSRIKVITEDDLQNEHINEIFRQAINSQSVELEKQSSILEAMQATMMTDKKFILEEMMYKCLSNGFVTPEEDKRIRADYKNYRAMQGNGEIKELYEKRYIHLHIKDDNKNNR